MNPGRPPERAGESTRSPLISPEKLALPHPARGASLASSLAGFFRETGGQWGPHPRTSLCAPVWPTASAYLRAYGISHHAGPVRVSTELLAHQGVFPPISGGSSFYHILFPLPRRGYFFCVFLWDAGRFALCHKLPAQHLIALRPSICVCACCQNGN